MARKRPTAEIVRLNKIFSRLELATALEISGGEDEAALAKLLRSSGDSSRMNISTLAANIGVPYKRVVECYRDMKRMESVVEAATHLPTVMKGIVEDAESKQVTCSSCEGTGRITIKKDDQSLPTETKLCIPCEGRGRVVKSGDPVARKQVLEIMELAGTSKAPIWAPGSNILIPGESLEDTLRGVRQRKEAQQNGQGKNNDQSGEPPTIIEG